MKNNIKFNNSTGTEIIIENNLAFKDLNKNGKLDKYENWTLSAEERAKDLISQMKKDIFRLDHSPKAIEQAIRDVLHNENKGSNLYLSNGKLRDLFRVSGCLGFTMWQNLSAFER